jgi:hypothetical protein
MYARMSSACELELGDDEEQAFLMDAADLADFVSDSERTLADPEDGELTGPNDG